AWHPASRQMAGRGRRRGLPDQVVGHLVARIGVGILFRRGVGIDPQRHRLREDRLGLVQHRGLDQYVAAVELDHAKFAGIERAQLSGVDVDALDLAAVLEVAGNVRRLVVEGLVLQQLLELRPRLAALARLFLAALLGLEALLLLLLGTQGPGLAQVHLAGRLAPGRAFTALAGGLPRIPATTALPLRATLAGTGRRLRTRLAAAVLARLRAAFGRGRLEAEVEELVAKGIGHGRERATGPGSVAAARPPRKSVVRRRRFASGVGIERTAQSAQVGQHRLQQRVGARTLQPRLGQRLAQLRQRLFLERQSRLQFHQALLEFILPVL